MYLKQIMFLGYTVLQLFCSYNLWYMYCYLHDEYFVFYISTFRIMYAAPSVAVFCSSLMSLTDMSFRYFLNASEMAPVTRLVAVYQFGVCIPHTLFIFSRSLYITIGFYLNHIFSQLIAVSFNIHVRFHCHYLLLRKVLSVCTC